MESFHTNSKTLSILILAIFFFTTCKKGNNANEGNILKRIIHASIGPTAPIDSFIYDGNKRLVAIRYSNNNSEYDKAIEYDIQNRLLRVMYSYQGVDKYSCSFVYDAMGHIIKKIATPVGGFNFADNESYAYDNLGRLISDTTYHNQSNTIQYYSTFKYDDNGNIAEQDFRNFINPNNQGKTTFIYDTNRNPFNALGSNYFHFSGDLRTLSVNNVVEIRPWWSAAIVNNIGYQTNRLPNKITTINPNGPYGPFSYTVLIEYLQ